MQDCSQKNIPQAQSLCVPFLAMVFMTTLEPHLSSSWELEREQLSGRQCSLIRRTKILYAVWWDVCGFLLSQICMRLCSSLFIILNHPFIMKNNLWPFPIGRQVGVLCLNKSCPSGPTTDGEEAEREARDVTLV